jgi:hypothetical protein
MGFEPTTYSMGSKSSANDFQPLRPPRQVHELAVALLTKIEADEEVSDLEVRQLAAAVLEAEPVWRHFSGFQLRPKWTSASAI